MRFIRIYPLGKRCTLEVPNGSSGIRNLPQHLVVPPKMSPCSTRADPILQTSSNIIELIELLAAFPANETTHSDQRRHFQLALLYRTQIEQIDSRWIPLQFPY